MAKSNPFSLVAPDKSEEKSQPEKLSDGTRLSGFVTEDENKPPRECGNCRWFDGKKNCGHPVVNVDPEVKKDSKGKALVDADDCCDNFQNKK